ncbi:MAG TPA: hypothetical protein VF555_01300 [Variovorax sp.]
MANEEDRPARAGFWEAHPAITFHTDYKKVILARLQSPIEQEID